MLKIRAARSPQYYEQREFAREDYYAEHEQSPGEWIGRGAALLGLAGGPGEEGLSELLAGRHPLTGAPLAPDRPPPRNAGFDLTFTAPKSVSVLLAVGGVEVRRIVLEAQEAGGRAALDYLEREACFVRRGRAGAQVLPAEGFAGAMYHHEMARSGDPHLHTHVVLANAARGPDGRWSAPDMRAVYTSAKAAGAIQEAVLRDELTRRLGARWEKSARWGYEVRGVPEAARAHFSARHREIAELAAVRGWLTLAGKRPSSARRAITSLASTVSARTQSGARGRQRTASAGPRLHRSSATATRPRGRRSPRSPRGAWTTSSPGPRG
jgi:conjugative relaxase-like TrwC/TraI family protein